MLQQAMLMISSGNVLVTAEGANFANTTPTNYMTLGSSLTSDGTTGIFSVWVKVGLLTYNNGILLISKDGKVQFYLTKATAFSVYIVVNMSHASGSVNFYSYPHTIPINDGAWHHFLISYNIAGSTAQIYVDDVSHITIDVITNTVVANYDDVDWGVSVNPPGGIGVSDNYNGGMAEFYFAPNQHLDFSVTDNRRKFVSSGIKPVYLGSTGELPTGVSPVIYFHIPDGGDANTDFPVNLGSGGDFTVTGTLTNTTTSPSD